jgi:hypothetical protein
MDDVLDQEQRENALIEAGLAAKALLESEHFNSVLSRLASFFSEALFATEPHESKKREMYYNNTVALQAIVDLLYQDVAACDEIIEARNEAEQ